MRVVWIAMCLAGLAVSCASVPDPIDGGVDPKTWTETRGPTDGNHHQFASFYLSRMILLAGDEKSGATDRQKTELVQCFAARWAAIHPATARDASWARVHRAYRLALDKDWTRVIHALGKTDGPAMDPTSVFATPKGWPGYKPASVNINLTIAQLHTKILTLMEPAATVDPNGWSAEQYECAKDTIENCVPRDKLSGDVAWTSVWESLEGAEERPQDPANDTCDEPTAAAIICEVCPD